MDKRKLFTMFTEMIGDKFAGYDSMDNLLQEVVSTGKMATLLNSITAAQLLTIISKNGSVLYDDIIKACDKPDITAEIESVARDNEKNHVFGDGSRKGINAVTAREYIKNHPEIFGETESKKNAVKKQKVASYTYSGGCSSSPSYSYSGGCGGSSSYGGGC